MAMKLSLCRFFLSACLLVCAALPLHAWAIDTDGDGVDDSVDAFPNDPCAATDTDHDGLPDLITCSPIVVAADGFESGNFTALPWVYQGWTIQSSAAWKQSGKYSAKSSSYPPPLQLTLTLPSAGQINFWWAGYGSDLFFYVDGVRHTYYRQQGHIVSYSFAAGTHTFQWVVNPSSLGGTANVYVDDVSVTAAATDLVEDTDDDNDGVLDVNDKFPLNAAASVDDDNDGLPDQWNQPNPYGCAANALTCNGLRLDPDTVNQIVWPLNSPYKGSSIRENNTWQ